MIFQNNSKEFKRIQGNAKKREFKGIQRILQNSEICAEHIVVKINKINQKKEANDFSLVLIFVFFDSPKILLKYLKFLNIS